MSTGTDNLDLVFRALADPHRRQILDLLRRKAQTTGELVAAFDQIGRCAVMKHLGILHDAGLVLYRREGRYRLNYLNPVPIRQIYDRWMVGLFEVEASAALLSNLKSHIEKRTKQRSRS